MGRGLRPALRLHRAGVFDRRSFPGGAVRLLSWRPTKGMTPCWIKPVPCTERAVSPKPNRPIAPSWGREPENAEVGHLLGLLAPDAGLPQHA